MKKKKSTVREQIVYTKKFSSLAKLNLNPE